MRVERSEAETGVLHELCLRSFCVAVAQQFSESSHLSVLHKKGIQKEAHAACRQARSDNMQRSLGPVESVALSSVGSETSSVSRSAWRSI